MTGVETILGLLGGGILLLMFIWLVVALYMAYFDIDVIFEHMKNSSAITSLTFLRDAGPSGRLRMISNIADHIRSPRKGIEKGSISAEDIENLPAPIKRKLIILGRSAFPLLGTLIFLWGIGKMIGRT